MLLMHPTILLSATGSATAAAPGVGNVLGGIGELMFGAGILIKNCVGVTALIVLLAVGCIPVLKLHPRNHHRRTADRSV